MLDMSEDKCPTKKAQKFMNREQIDNPKLGSNANFEKSPPRS
jgi:hypothetical protein